MTKKTAKVVGGHARGRPTKYKAEYAEQARKLCLLGYTDIELADFFGVSEATVNNWKRDHTDFLESIKNGKHLADAQVVDKLFNRAIGYDAPDVDIRVVNQEIVQTPIIKHYPPDPVSAIFWLKNRQRGKWRDKPEVEDAQNNEPPPVKINVNVIDARKRDDDSNA